MLFQILLWICQIQIYAPKSCHPISHKGFLFFIFYFIFRINDRQSHTKLFSVYVGLEKKSCMVQSSMDQIVPRSHHHTDISNGKVDPHGSFGIVAQFLHTWHELILTRVYEGLFYTLLVLIYTLYWQSHQGNCSTQLILLSSQFYFIFFILVGRSIKITRQL